MKAIIPVAGAGIKLRPLTHTQPKPLIPIAGKPILGHIIEGLHTAGIQEFIFVVGYMGEKIRSFIQENYTNQLKFHFIEQEPRQGTGHAISLCRDWVGKDEVLIMLGDTIVDADFSTLVAMQDTFVCVQEVEEPWRFGVVQVDEQGYVTHLIEKPTIPKSNLALVGLYKIRETEALFSAIDYILSKQLKTHNEYQLTDALTEMVRAGIKIRTQAVTHWFDCGRKNVLLETNRILLSRQAQVPLPVFENSVFLPPVSIAPNCKIKNSIIGPYVAIGEHSIIENSIVSDSILGAYSMLDTIILKHSIVGNDATMIGNSYSINIGDNTEIDFQQ